MDSKIVLGAAILGAGAFFLIKKFGIQVTWEPKEPLRDDTVTVTISGLEYFDPWPTLPFDTAELLPSVGYELVGPMSSSSGSLFADVNGMASFSFYATYIWDYLLTVEIYDIPAYTVTGGLPVKQTINKTIKVR